MHERVRRVCALAQLPEEAVIVVDSVRILNQIEAIRRAYDPRVVHIHLDANIDVLSSRYEDRKKLGPKLQELLSYAELSKNKTEAHVGDEKNSSLQLNDGEWDVPCRVLYIVPQSVTPSSAANPASAPCEK